MSDFRIKRRDEAIARAEAAEAMAEKGGDALTTEEGYWAKAASSRRFAAWIDQMIAVKS